MSILTNMQRAAHRAGAKRQRTETEPHALNRSDRPRTGRETWLDATVLTDAVLTGRNKA